METMSTVMASLAGLIHVAAFIIYNRKTFRGEITPNTAMWTLWTALSMVNAASFRSMSGDLIASILPLSSTAACVLSYLFILTIGKFGRLRSEDWIALGIGLLAVGVWRARSDATYGNLILQVAIVISFIPTYRAVWRDATQEKPFPWFLWSAAYVLMITVVGLRWRGAADAVRLVYPVNCLILHGAVGVLTARTAAPLRAVS